MNIRICDAANQIPLNPPVSKGEVSDPLFGKEGLGEVSGRCGGELRSQDAGFYGAIKPFSYGGVIHRKTRLSIPAPTEAQKMQKNFLFKFFLCALTVSAVNYPNFRKR